MATWNLSYRVHESKVQSFLLPGQPVDELIHRTAKLTKYFAAGHINSRTGTLARMMQVNRPSRSGALETTSLVFARTSYAMYVHEGTGRIFPKKGKYLTIPRRKQSSPNLSGGTLRKMWKKGKTTGGKPYFTATSVRGQRSNPFLEKGLHEAMGTLR